MSMTDDLPDRTKKALYGGMRVLKVSDGNYLVHSQSSPETFYNVHIDSPSEVECSCKDFEYRGGHCKHIRAAALADAKHLAEEVNEE